MTNRKAQNIVTLVVTAKDFGTREVTLRDDRRLGKAEKRAAYWTKVWQDAGHLVTRK